MVGQQHLQSVLAQIAHMPNVTFSFSQHYESYAGNRYKYQGDHNEGIQQANLREMERRSVSEIRQVPTTIARQRADADAAENHQRREDGVNATDIPGMADLKGSIFTPKPNLRL